MRALAILRALLVATLVCAPAAAAATVRMDLVSSQSVLIAGSFEATLPRGMATTEYEPRSFDATFDGLRGTLQVQRWTERWSALGSFPGEPPVTTEHRLDGATLTWRAVSEPTRMRIATGEGDLIVSGDADAEGKPERFGRVAVREAQVLVPGAGFRPALVPIRWEPHFRALGTVAPDQTPIAPFPQLEHAVLGARGEIHFMAFGGNVTFPTPDGPRTERLGSWNTSTGTPGVAWEVEYVQIRFDGSALSASLPLGDSWGAAGPEVRFRADGIVHWTRATGEATLGSRTTRFDDANVTLDFAGDLLDALPVVDAPALDVPYEASGDARSLRIDGASVAAPTPVPLAAPAAAGAFVLLLLAFTKVGQTLVAYGAAWLYTRFTTAQLLEHPQRRRLVELVLAEPGIHQRELHRRVGGAWGVFAYHLHMLERAGHTRLERQGSYVLVYPPHGRVDGPTIPQPIARAIYHALPVEGTSVPLAELAQRVDASPELIRYHIRALEARGLVRRVRLPRGQKAVARIPSEAPPARPAPVSSKT